MPQLTNTVPTPKTPTPSAPSPSGGGALSDLNAVNSGQPVPKSNTSVPAQPVQQNSFLQDFQQTANEMFGNQDFSYPTKPVGLDDQINSMPNSEKLSGFERWLYKKLPGFSESTAGKVLASFGETVPGKALAKLDVLAEGLERTLGLVAQYRDMKPGDDFRLKDAWAAGSLFYDVVNLPKLAYDKTGKMVGIEFNSDLPGTFALTEARREIQSGKSLEEVRSNLYSNLGALALRSQLQDTVGHVVADPLNWALGAVKPIERLHAIRNLALTGKLDVEVVQDLEKTARAAGNLEDAAKYAEAIAKAEKDGKAVTRFDRFAIMMTGGSPYLQDVTKMSEKSTWLSKLNPFALTPQARASELLDVVAANVGEYLIRPNWTKDPEEFVKLVQSAAQGGIGDQWGHLAMTVQGRTVQGILSNSDGSVKALAQEWKVYEGERNFLSAMSGIMGQDERKLWALASDNPAAFFQKIVAKAEEPGMEALKAEIQAGRLTEDTVTQVGKLDKTIPLMKEEFYTKALVTIQDTAMQQAIVQFGIKEKGVLTKWSDAIKAWETLPFIKANPANYIRNVVNNEVTLLGRGLQGFMTDGMIKNFWEGKFMPPQMKRAFAFAGEGEFDATQATERMIKTLEGTGDSLPQKIKKFAGKIKLGPTVKDAGGEHALFDFSHYSGQMEAKASLKASTNGWMEFHNNYWNTKTGFTSISKTLDPSVIDEMEKVVPGITDILDNVAQSAGADSEKFAKLLQTELEHNVASVFTDASENLGYKIDDVLGAELSTQLREGLPQAMKDGKVNEFVNGLKTQAEQHVDEMFNKHVENLPGIIKAQVQAGGPMQYHRIFGKAMDEFWGGNIEHAIRMSSVNELMDYAQKTGDFKKVSGLWDKIFQDGENHFGRVWKKFDAYQEGLKAGAMEAGIKYPEEVGNAFKGMKDGWKELFDFRNTEYQKFFDAKLSGKDYSRTLEEIQGKIDNMYTNMVSKEDELYQHIDDLMANQLDDFSGNLYRNFRDQASQLRVADRNKTAEFFKKIRSATKEEAPNMWAKYWQERTTGLEQMRQLEVRGSSAIQGDSEAVAMFAKNAQTQPGTIYDLANQYGIPSATGNGGRNDRRILNTVNKYSEAATPPEKLQEVFRNAKVPDEVAKAYTQKAQYQKAVDEIKALMKETPLGEEHSKLVTRLQEANNKLKGSGMELSALAKKSDLSVSDLNEIANKSYKYTNVNDIPLDVAKQAFEQRMGAKAADMATASEKSFLPDAHMMFKDPQPIETALSELNYGRTYAALDSVIESATKKASQKSALLKDLPEELQNKVMGWTEKVNSEMSGFRSAAVQYSAFRRDSALLNYNRRTNFDNWVGHIAPFAFWTTHSMANWAVYSLDRPAMLTSYFRARKLFETAGLPDQNVPTRLKGNIRVNLPFTPDWMGDTFIDPLRTMLPFDSWLQPWEKAQTDKFSMEGKAKNTLDQMMQAGSITQDQYDQAIKNKSGDVWDKAMETVKEGGDNYNAMDFVNMTMTPHAPLMWAYNALRGQKNEIGPFTPMTRTVKNFATMMGVDDWSNSPYNIEARIRKSMGLPAYDKWDDYRVGREISNIAADGNHSMEDVKAAMEVAALVESGKMTSKEAVATNPLYKEATKRANQEYAGGWSGSMLALLGINVKSLPTGEQSQRILADKFSEAYAAKKNGDPTALAKFFDDHPEYEARLALFKSPEERLKTFMIDNVWARWNDLPKVVKDEMKDQLGSDFENNIINKETQNYDAVSPLQLQVWLKLMGGKQVGKLDATTEAMTELLHLKTTDPETAWRVQTFYDSRDQFKDWYKLQNQYYELKSPDQKKAYLQKNPELKQYWDFRKNWMNKNPDLVRFLTDDPKQLKQYENKQRQPQVAVPNAEEIKSQLSQPTLELIGDWTTGQQLPPTVRANLALLAQQYGMDYRTLLGILTNR